MFAPSIGDVPVVGMGDERIDFLPRHESDGNDLPAVRSALTARLARFVLCCQGLRLIGSHRRLSPADPGSLLVRFTCTILRIWALRVGSLDTPHDIDALAPLTRREPL
ncbi:hypothetical protein DNK44_03460 [Pseudomonas dryadis]|uniref:Uncharacterized protein n=1 Tax=Phytopseudomonas dryadis TaxID=2487520 RepID=A0A4Q9R886_9GAMM|nr:hypothetical protein DNK44_03460 [Pseudomonas dryadis]